MAGGAATWLICPLTAPAVAAMRADMAAAASAGADAVECRLDLLAAPPSRDELFTLLTDPPLPVIVTCRPVRQGGRFGGDESARLELLRHAAACQPAYIDIEADVPVELWPHAKIIISDHDFSGCRPESLQRQLTAMADSSATVVKLAFTASGPQHALLAMDLLRQSRKPAIILAMGEHGVASRILCHKFGAMGTFASLSSGSESAPGQLSLADMVGLYRWRSIGASTAVYGVIGCPVGHSMSPAIHNAAFEACGMDAVYVPLRIEPGAEPFAAFMDPLLERPWLDWRGLSVTIPHKENALAYVGEMECDELSVAIGAINTISMHTRGRRMQPSGDNTDYSAAIDALCGAMGITRDELAGRQTAVLGAGGAARAIVAALRHYGANVTVHNRTLTRARSLADEFGASAAGDDTAPQAEIIINCTPLGMHPAVDGSPLEAIPQGTRVVFDTIYNPVETRLLRLARQAGCTCISGVEMFVNQAAAQFEIWTNRPAPRDIMRQVVLRQLGARE